MRAGHVTKICLVLHPRKQRSRCMAHAQRASSAASKRSRDETEHVSAHPAFNRSALVQRIYFRTFLSPCMAMIKNESNPIERRELCAKAPFYKGSDGNFLAVIGDFLLSRQKLWKPVFVHDCLQRIRRRDV
jgi:hypothetical protein